MTPAETITRKLKAAIESAGATVPVVSLLLEALDGDRHETPSSGIMVNVHISAQHSEPLPLYSFAVAVALSVAIDDDKSGSLFKANYDAIWAAFDHLCRADNCAELGDELDEIAEGEAHVFAVDGFQLDAGDAPDYQDDGNGGTWTVSFSATVTGRAN